ncbi:peptide-methionine (S)-S-oxide reductase MsrA [Sphingomonas parva]|uniref:Peptide methionine sulfoxide reductase MsrA n=2 Tax=Sphingomonas parva TaxID=2555898 RepID=A0A4Y8ZMU2_9SPHN|nr:peptide-methionine (S)-S-oxide reductase MsrA [Sphingomonas parva]
MFARWGFVLALALASCGQSGGDEAAAQQPRAAPGQAKAVFAGGCFWCTEADFEKVPGVVSAVSGYTGGTLANPSYKKVSAGGTGHYEAVLVTYDPRRVSYAALVRHFFRTVDPTDAGGQFCDRGDSYRTAVFVGTPAERKLAEAEKAAADRQLGGRVVTPIVAAGRFYPAEDYHQDYYKKNPVRYRYYRWRCGRDARLEQVWGKK